MPNTQSVNEDTQLAISGLSVTDLQEMQTRFALKCIEQLVRKALAHLLLATLAREQDDPADGQGAAATGRHLDGHLVRGATHAAALDLEHRGDVADGLFHDLHRITSRAVADALQGVVDGALGDRLLAVPEDLVDELRHDGVVVDGVRDERTA
jgi:hypothetical protein